MGILAAAVQADISVVTVFQLFRLLFIFLCILPLIKWVYREKKLNCVRDFTAFRLNLFEKELGS